MTVNRTLLQINVCNNIYSTGKIASDIGELAIKEGWQSYIASSAHDEILPSNNSSITIGNSLDYYIHVLESRLFDNSGLGISSQMSTLRLIGQIKKINPDIIHLHIIHGYYLNLPILFNFLSSYHKPVVWTVHSCWEFTGHCAFFDTIGCEKWKMECGNCPQIKQYPTSWIRDRSRRNYLEKKKLFTSIPNLTLVPVSMWLGRLLKDSFLGKYPVCPIYNGIDTQIFTPSPNNLSIREKYGLTSYFVAIGVASTWEPRKNLKDYLRLAHVVPENVRIVLVGLEKQEIETLPTNVIGIERTTSPQELVDIYSIADVVLNLSLEETFGLTTVEGFACGTPGIVYNCTASPELLSEETGFIVESGDIDGVLKCIKSIAEKGKSSYSSACRQRALRYYDKNENYKQYINLYNKLINNVSI